MSWDGEVHIDREYSFPKSWGSLFGGLYIQDFKILEFALEITRMEDLTTKALACLIPNQA